VLAIGLFFIALTLESVQTYIAKRLTNYISEELKTTVRIERVNIRFLKSIILEELYVEDLHGDTLIYTSELKVWINDISTKNRKLEIGKLTLHKGNFKSIHYRGEEHNNLHFLTAYFSSNDTTTSSGKPWDIRLSGISLREFSYTYKLENDTANVEGVNFSDLVVNNINGDFHDFKVIEDSIFVKINTLSFAEQSGFKLNSFSADAKISGTEIRLNRLKIITPFSDIQTNLVFQFDSFPDFDEFTSRIRWQTDFTDSKVSSNDIAFFAPELNGINQVLKINGLFKGKVNNFKGRNVSFQWGRNTMFNGNISMSGLPNIENTFIDVTANEITTDKKDVESIPVSPFDGKHFVSVPQNFSLLGKVKFKGKFTGFISDFVAFGNISTALGSISSDLNLKYNERRNTSEYSGNLAAFNFNVGRLIAYSDLGTVSFKASVKGSGLKLDDINSKLKGNIDQLVFKNYTYRNIDIDGQIAKKLFSGSLAVNEENVQLNFSGSLDFREKLPELDFTADIQEINLSLLNLVNSEEQIILKTGIRAHIVGSNLDNIVGGIDIVNTDFITGNKLFRVNSILLRADKVSSVQTFSIESDIVDASFIGRFELAKIGDAFKEILPRYLPSVILPVQSEPGDQDFTFDIRLKNLNVLSEFYLPSLSISPNTSVKGFFKTTSRDLVLDLSAAYLKFKNYSVEDFHIHTSTNANGLKLDIYSKYVNNGNYNFIFKPAVSAFAANNKVEYTINMEGIDSSINRLILNGNVGFLSETDFDLKIDSSDVWVDGRKWNLANDNLVSIDSSAVTFKSFVLSSENEKIDLSGTLGKRQEDRFKLFLFGFNLEHLNTFIGFENKSFLGGIADGEIVLSGAFDKFKLESDMKISNLSLENDTLGNAIIKSGYISEEDVITGEVSIIKGTAVIVGISGNYYVKKEEESLDFRITLNNLYVHPIESYLTGVLSKVYGKVSAALTLTGTPKKPALNGSLSLNKMSLVVDYLNTQYSFNTVVRVKENEFLIDNLKLIDVNNNEAILKGKVMHNYFSNFQFDVELKANRFQALNTTSKENSLYYGVANATGNAKFKGPINNMVMDIALSPERGTKLNIPLNSTEDISSSGFITFINKTGVEGDESVSGRVDLSGVTLNMKLDMNRNADIKIIFDEKIGDVITGSGTGSLQLDINTAGNFNMFGTYNIERGEYLFTLQNLINKKFIVKSGGKITWAGDPYEALVDLSAVYVVYTSSLYNIIQDTTYKRRVPVDCQLNLTNKLLNPIITYGISVRGLDPTVESLLQTKLNSEQEINRQMFGLLMLNQFLPISGAGQTGTRLDAGAGAEASATELLSNQVSNWLGQLNTDVNISVNYRAKDNYSNEELRVMVSKSFMDERLTIEGNVGFLGEQSYLNSNVVGDFYAEYKVSEDGRFRVKGFNRSNADDIIKYSQAPYTQGIGFFYRKEFNEFSDLFVKWRKKKEKDKDKEKEKVDEPELIPQE
jgi:hypothetical protein